MSNLIGMPKNDEPKEAPPAQQGKCPHCEAHPIKLNITAGTDPSGQYILVEVFCSDCKKLVPVFAVPNPAAMAGPSPFGPHVRRSI